MSRMEKRADICTAWVLCLVFTLSGSHGSAGTDPSPSPEIPSAFPPSGQVVPSPTCCDDSPIVDPPSSLPISKGPAPHITFDFSPTLPPDVKGMTRSSHPSPSPTHVADNGTWPVARPPALDGQASPNPARAANDISPSSSISPTPPTPKPQTSQTPQGNIYGQSPSSDAPTALPMAPVLSSPSGLPVNAPPSDTVQTKEPQRPAVSPISSLPPDVYGGGEGVPVAAPPPEMSNHLSPINHRDTRGLFPVLSPAPHDRKPYKYTPAPTSHPRPPSANVVEVPAPSISHHIHEPREEYRSPAAAPTFSLPHAASKRYGAPVAAPSEETHYRLSPVNHVHITGPPVLSPIPHEDRRAHKYASAPSTSYHQHPSAKLVPVPAPAISNHQHEARENERSPSFAPSNLFPPFYVQGPTPSPSPSPLVHPDAALKHGGRHHAPPPLLQSTGHLHTPTQSPSGSVTKKPRAPVPQPIRAFPPPPPNLDCLSLPCTEPYTTPPPGSPCICALPMKVKLRLGVALYTFFPSVSELAQEIADGVSMKQSQVRVMGANAATEQPEKTIVLIDLVPLGQKFDNAMALLTYERFWHKQISIQASYFGDYDVLFVLYPGLPPSPPLPPSDTMDGPFGSNSNSRTIQPLGVDVRKRRKEKLSATVIAVLVVSSVIAFILCAGAAWFLLLKLKHQGQSDLSILAPQLSMPPYMKASGTGPTLSGSGPGSTSGSLSSSIATYTGSAKTFSAREMERATNMFDDSRVIGEGGFGRVYEGKLEDGMKVAVKVLKRDDQQGSREFLSEIEMLSRLHHRNLVKLIGICTDEHLRCLVYELIPNGSVESHLHGVHKEAGLLDWGARMKIALGSARALTYLHEDSSPRVIHRDFKSSNILLEYDFTPKVSDFGLARTALDGGNEHISTKVMGTFGYVAPEYALTGHLLVKSDVYSYGVVLLELLTGRKPVDMSQPPGQENLVAWAHPLLISKEGLESIIDPALCSNFPLDSVAKVAAIASMCVQPEVSNRPFMGEVVQALKLVCHETDEPGGSGSFSLEGLPPSDMDLKIDTGIVFDGDSSRALSSEIFGTSAMLRRETSGSFRRHSSSGPLKMSKSGQFWRGMGTLSGGSMSDNGVSRRFSSNMEGGETRSSGWS